MCLSYILIYCTKFRKRSDETNYCMVQIDLHELHTWALENHSTGQCDNKVDALFITLLCT